MSDGRDICLARGRHTILVSAAVSGLDPYGREGLKLYHDHMVPRLGWNPASSSEGRGGALDPGPGSPVFALDLKLILFATPSSDNTAPQRGKIFVWCHLIKDFPESRSRIECAKLDSEDDQRQSKMPPNPSSFCNASPIDC